MNTVLRTDLSERLGEEVKYAQKVIYELDGATRVDCLQMEGRPIHVKREDTSRIHSYKWRGSFCKMHRLILNLVWK